MPVPYSRNESKRDGDRHILIFSDDTFHTPVRSCYVWVAVGALEQSPKTYPGLRACCFQAWTDVFARVRNLEGTLSAVARIISRLNTECRLVDAEVVAQAELVSSSEERWPVDTALVIEICEVLQRVYAEMVEEMNQEPTLSKVLQK